MATWRFPYGEPDQVHKPMRGDEIAEWLRQYRDTYDRYTREWYALDNALDNYRLHADMGLPLNSIRE